MFVCCIVFNKSGRQTAAFFSKAKMSDFQAHQIYGVIGHPLDHSLSPLLHSAAFRLLDLPAALSPWPLTAAGLADFIRAVRLLNIRGACVTLPLKEAILPFLDEVSDLAREVGAVNTIYRQGPKVCGENTDLSAFLAPLKARLSGTGHRVLLLGAGGAARAAAAALRRLDLKDIWVSHRGDEKSETLARDFGLKSIAWKKRGEIGADLLVNLTPLGLKGDLEKESPYPAEALRGRGGLVCDVVYNPLETRFLREAAAAGWAVVDGLDMFLGQAEAQFRLWTGLDLPEEARQKVRDFLRKA